MTDERLKSYVARYASLLEEAEANRVDQKDLAEEIRNKGDGINPAYVKKLAALTLSDKKVTKLRADNAAMARYNRESGAGLDLGIEVEAPPAVTDDKQDARVVEAIAMLRDRKSIRFVAQALNMGHGTVQRLRAALFAVPTEAVPSEVAGTGTPPHDPATGEITESTGGSTLPPAGNDAPPPSSAAPSPPVEPQPEPDRAATDDARPQGAADREPPSTPDLTFPSDGKVPSDGEASFLLGQRLLGGKEPVGEVDTAKTLAVIGAIQRASVDELVEAALAAKPDFLDRRKAARQPTGGGA